MTRISLTTLTPSPLLAVLAPAMVLALLLLVSAGHALANDPFLTPPSPRPAEQTPRKTEYRHALTLAEESGSASRPIPARPPATTPRITPPSVSEMVALQRELRQRMADFSGRTRPGS
ncbi:hypothetical protein [Desulfonatronum sp. SC1]|uniref:hypothetical protein n=1 Tax=Desulfonatronum sp. SC1 TaxID=2109626 RepID=UPI0011B22411|nr:hypothetical protein [Desulfonatronum sp. SC1]